MQDFTGVPAVVDLAAMRSAVARLGGDPKKVNPVVPVDLVIDHSVQVDFFATPEALQRNTEMEFQRNRERYEFLKWGQKAFDNFRVVPPMTGIVHQVNLEYLADVVGVRRLPTSGSQSQAPFGDDKTLECFGQGFHNPHFLLQNLPFRWWTCAGFVSFAFVGWRNGFGWTPRRIICLVCLP